MVDYNTYIVFTNDETDGPSDFVTFTAKSDDAARRWVEAWCRNNAYEAEVLFATRSVALNQERNSGSES